MSSNDKPKGTLSLSRKAPEKTQEKVQGAGKKPNKLTCVATPKVLAVNSTRSALDSGGTPEKHTASPSNYERKEPQKMTAKKDSKDEITTLLQALEALFKPIKKGPEEKAPIFSKKLETSIKRVLKTEGSEKGDLLPCVTFVGQTDIEFRKLLQILLLAQDCSSSMRQALMGFAIRAVSDFGIKTAEGHTNLFLAVAGDISLDNPGLVAKVMREISDRYDQRVENLKLAIKENEGVVPSRVRSLSVEQLKNQKDNVIAICALWAIESGKGTPDKVISQLELRLSQTSNQDNTAKRAAYFLTSSLANLNGRGASEVVTHYSSSIRKLQELKRNSESALERIQAELKQAGIKRLELEQRIDVLQGELADAQAVIKQERTQTQEKQLDEQATRVHLKDDVGKAKAKAYNLLSEDVIEPLRLSLKALQRDKPKVANAEHQIELALECIEREISWFKK